MKTAFLILGSASWGWLAYRGFTGFAYPEWWIGAVHAMMAILTLLEIVRRHYKDRT